MKKIAFFVALLYCTVLLGQPQIYYPFDSLRVLVSGISVRFPRDLQSDSKTRYEFTAIEAIHVTDGYERYSQSVLLSMSDFYKIRAFISSGKDGVLFLKNLPAMDRFILLDNSSEESTRDIYDIAGSLLVHEMDKEMYPDADPLRICNRKTCNGNHHVLESLQIGIVGDNAYIILGPPNIDNGEPVPWDYQNLKISRDAMGASMEKKYLNLLFDPK